MVFDDTSTRRRAPTAPPAVGYRLTVVDGADRGRAIDLDVARPSRVLVGTSAACDLVLTDSMVSRRHAALELTGVSLSITDLGSTNGTQVNGVSIEVAHLAGGETLRLGATSVKVELRAPTSTTEAPPSGFGRMIGSSPRMRQVYSLASQLASSDVAVVIEGETGTGKELLAENIHEASRRSGGPFVVFDCAATPPGEVRSVLAGMFEMASGGTLLIDEVGDLPSETQGILLRAIERGEIMRPGEDRWTKVDTRVLSATSRDLEKFIESGKFREDLFYRLAVARLELPPLRRRVGDVALLTRHFFHTASVSEVPKEFGARYDGYHWPGNVRELANAVARFVALGHDAAMIPSRRHGPGAPLPGNRADDPRSDVLGQILEEGLPFTQARQRVLDVFERAYVERVLEAHQGNVARAAAASGIARRYFQLIRARQR